MSLWKTCGKMLDNVGPSNINPQKTLRHTNDTNALTSMFYISLSDFTSTQATPPCWTVQHVQHVQQTIQPTTHTTPQNQLTSNQ